MSHQRIEKDLLEIKGLLETQQKWLLSITAPYITSIYDWRAVISGPEHTEYSDRELELSILFPNDYPKGPPFVKFMTPITHSDPIGYINIKILQKEQWSSTYTILNVLFNVWLLLSVTNF